MDADDMSPPQPTPSETGALPAPVDITPAAARAALDRSAGLSLASPRDRTVLATGTALSGLLLGGYLAAMWGLIPRRSGWTDTAPLIYVALLAGVTVWQRRAARSVPLGAKRILNRALVASIVVAGVGVLGINATVGREGASVALGGSLGVLTGLPLVIAAWLIGRAHA